MDYGQRVQYPFNMPRSQSPDGRPALGPLFGYDGKIDQPIAADYLGIPWHLSLEGEDILYAYYSPSALSQEPRPMTLDEQRHPGLMSKRGLPHLKSPSPRVLDGFMKLADQSHTETFEFARRWGVLDLCEHGLPIGHRGVDLRWGIPRTPRCTPVKPPGKGFPSWCHFGLEKAEWWRDWARKAKALMTIAASLKRGSRGDSRDWNTVAAWENEGLQRPLRNDSVTAEWHLLCQYVNGWCQMANLAPYLICRDQGSVMIRFASLAAPGRLFGVIGLQMMARISSKGSMAICSGCGEIYKPTRIPNPSRLNFCPDCGRTTSVGMAKARMAERKRKARALHAEGMSPSKIAGQIGSQPSTVRRWVGKWKAS